MAWPSPQRPHWLHLQVLTDNAVDKAGRQQRAKGLNPSHAFGSPPPPIPPFPPTNPHKPHPALSYHSPTLSHPTPTLSQERERAYILPNIHFLFLGMSALLLVDSKYLSRVWPTYESWLSMQSTTALGMYHQPDLAASRCNVRCIHGASDIERNEVAVSTIDPDKSQNNASPVSTSNAIYYLLPATSYVSNSK